MLLASDVGGCAGAERNFAMSLKAVGDTDFREDSSGDLQWIIASLAKDPAGGTPITVLSRQDAATQEIVIASSAAIWLAFLGALFALALACAVWLIARAQSDIVARTDALNDARRSLARFVSRHGQTRAAAGDGRARRLQATVVFIDIRDFSSYAETVSPEQAGVLVENVAAIAFERILLAGGDVDRLVGDGLVALFEGSDRKARAWRAVADIFRLIEKASLPRGVGGGLHDGLVVEATIGTGERLDHTVLGRDCKCCRAPLRFPPALGSFWRQKKWEISPRASRRASVAMKSCD